MSSSPQPSPMVDDSLPTSSPSAPRSKLQRNSASVRGRSSPPPSSNGDPPNDGRPPTKRARKAINCEPCRNSKLKCDRNRPCSSCVLRGTSAMCYQDARGPDGNDAYSRGDDFHYTRIDPAQEIGRLRHSISLLEAYIFPHHRSNPALQKRTSEVHPHPLTTPKKEAVDPDVSDKAQAGHGLLGRQQNGGLYAGPTSAATHLITGEGRIDDADARQSQEQEDFPATYDNDLLTMFPPLNVADGLIRYYFDFCNWVYRHVNEQTFTHQWDRFKSGASGDRIVLATTFVIMGVSTFYLPPQHPLLETFPNQTQDEIGQKFYELACIALQRRMAEGKMYTLELVELLLIRCHYLSLSKRDSEEIWYIKGELFSIGTAMGLHRDPGKWHMSRGVAERRRWAWWHIILLERWQAFMFGRPISIASHHYDTQLPSYCDPAIDKTGRLYLPNIALLRLADILGQIMDDAVSVRPVPYDNVQANDRALTQWLENLPSELDLDDFRVARSLASPNMNVQRLGVQSVIVRTSYHHIRFTLHRPYASIAANPNLPSTTKTPSPDVSKYAQSLEIAVSAAEKLIAMVGHIRPDHLARTSLAVPAHMNWAPFHAFSAAMFFSFQLIANPDQPGASLFRDSIRKAIMTLDNYRGSTVADKASTILKILAPLYSSEFPQESKEERAKLRVQILGTVRKLAFPYHDSHERSADSPGRSVHSPSSVAAPSPPNGTLVNLPAPYDPLGGQGVNMYPQHGSTFHSPQAQPQLPPALSHSQSITTLYSQPYTISPQQSLYTDTSRYQYGVEDSAMWGAAVGFNQGEWSQFLDGIRTEPHAS